MPRIYQSHTGFSQRAEKTLFSRKLSLSHSFLQIHSLVDILFLCKLEMKKMEKQYEKEDGGDDFVGEGPMPNFLVIWDDMML